jgi:hypothetical protein
MRFSKEKCRDIANGLPGGLNVESFIESESDGCRIEVGQQASHVVKVQNRTLLRFKITVAAESESGNLHYGDDKKTWDAEIDIGHRPYKGGFRNRTARESLRSGDDASEDESLKITVTYSALGCMCEGSSLMQLVVDTYRSDDATI